MTDRLRLGIIATEFPPERGGMQEHARGAAQSLSTHCDVVVFTRQGLGVPDDGYAVRPVLVRHLPEDFAILGREPVDAWLALNAGYARLAGRLDAPVFVYCHGNDFLDPFPRPGVVGQLAIGTLRRAPLLWRYAGPLGVHLRRRLLDSGLRRARHVFTNSRNTERLLRATYGLDDGQVTIVPPGVGDAFFQGRIPGPPDELRLLTVTRLETYTRRKNVDGVLRALALMRDTRVRYTVIGDGDDRPRLEALAQDLKLSDRVHFAGAVPQRELLNAYRDADLFVLVSRATALDVEGFGIVYLEASAAGLPCLASRAGGAVDAVLDGMNGILIDTAEPEDIAQGIRRFLSERTHFAAASVQDFARGYRWPVLAGRLVNEIQARVAMSDKSRRRAPAVPTG